ncbi:hypothetical protein NKH19_16485 [Mesorhizobium sp. M1338]|uniref:hypothetical protein n=1 Tax=unclassified Mesorhizobium TaxID=325217 RepID=UPI00333631FE
MKHSAAFGVNYRATEMSGDSRYGFPNLFKRILISVDSLGVFNRIATDAETQARSTVEEVEVLARIIMEKMQSLHGDSYRIDVNQRCGYVLVTKHNR